jgi:hypothetical protein
MRLTPLTFAQQAIDRTVLMADDARSAWFELEPAYRAPKSLQRELARLLVRGFRKKNFDPISDDLPYFADTKK